MIRRYTIVSELDDERLNASERELIDLIGQKGRERKIREALQRAVPGLEIVSVSEVDSVDVVL